MIVKTASQNLLNFVVFAQIIIGQQLIPILALNDFQLGFQHNLQPLSEDSGLLFKIIGFRSQLPRFISTVFHDLVGIGIGLGNNIGRLLLRLANHDLSLTLGVGLNLVSSFLSNQN